jgi:Peptidase family S41
MTASPPVRRASPALLALALLALSAAPARGQDACEADFDSVQSAVRRDYAGYGDKAPGREAALAALTDSVRAEARAAVLDPDACTTALRRWIAWFRDRHLAVSDRLPPPPRPGGEPAGVSVRPLPDINEPAAHWVDDSTAVLRLPDFGQRRKAAVDSLVAAHRERLLATPYLVIDVRGNGGGWTEVYASVIPLLYTGPIQIPGMDAWASEGNVAYAKTMLASDRLPAEIRTEVEALVPRMEAAPGSFVPLAPDTVVRMDTVHPLPRAVALLVDRRCASTCEQFVLDARQSAKVTVMGAENTGGLTDYGNARTIPLPSGFRRLHLPTARSRRLPANPMDMVGIEPAVKVPADEARPVDFAVRWLHAHAQR